MLKIFCISDSVALIISNIVIILTLTLKETFESAAQLNQEDK